MAYQKTKHVESAQKYLHQGKLSQAISEYQAILKHEPKDQVTLMTVGDLYVRQGETFQALEYFERLAQIYLGDGFLTKAIAIYKKITKLAPEEIRPFERLADLYVQQGVMSEARPLYLQMAEMHQRANRPAQAAGLLRKLLDAEPDNPRAQSRLSEILVNMGQSADAVAALRTAAELLLARGNHTEALAFVERALRIDSADQRTLVLKARALMGSGKQREARDMLQSSPDVESGGEASKLLVDLYLEAGEVSRAGDLAQRIAERDPKSYQVVEHVIGALLDRNEAEQALAMLVRICETALQGGHQDLLSDLIHRAAEALPQRIEPRELLVNVYRHANDSFRLPDALMHLAQAYEDAGQLETAVQTYAQILENGPENDSVRHKHEELKARLGLSEKPAEPVLKTEFPEEASADEEAPIEPEDGLDEETRLFVNQALTDVDLYSSYGLTEKAVELLELVLQRAPQHAAALERRLDLSVGLNDENKTVELAAQLERIYTEAGDNDAADRFADLRRRFERAAAQSLKAATVSPADQSQNAGPKPPEFSVPQSGASAPMEFEIPVVDAEPERELAAEPTQTDEFVAESVVHEVDLSEEWAALTAQVETRDSVPEPVQFPEPADDSDVLTGAGADHQSAEAEMSEDLLSEYDLAAQNETPAPSSETRSEEFQSLLQSVTAELGRVLPVESPKPVAPEVKQAALNQAALRQVAAKQAVPAKPAKNLHSRSGESLGGLLEELRADLEDDSDNNHDPETHYNLGIAYREMGLVDEAISEFQQAAKAYDRGSRFAYAMQSFTHLALLFVEKGQPAIAVNWYERALQLPGLDPETILALRYDLGISQEMAGDAQAAHKSFQQVYGSNIDYRDVAERLAALARAR